MTTIIERLTLVLIRACRPFDHSAADGYLSSSGLAGGLKSPPAFWKVKAQAKAEIQYVELSLNLDLDLSLSLLCEISGCPKIEK